MFRFVASALCVGTLVTGAALAQTNSNTNAPAGTTMTSPGMTSPSKTAPGMTTPSMTAPMGAATNRADTNLNPTNNSSTAPAAVTTSQAPSKTSAAPVPGRNSFTRGEASRRIQASGYANVKDLKKDNQGIWRGQATKNGQSVGVALDYQGNVVSQ